MAQTYNNIKIRQSKIEEYYKSPNRCLFCDSIIHPNHHKISYVRKKKFCNNKCKHSFFYKENKKSNKTRDSSGICLICGIKIYYKKHKKFNSNLFYKRKYCKNCKEKGKCKTRKVDLTEEKTLEEIWKRYKNYTSGRSSISRHARKVFYENKKENKCVICGYSKYIEVCHIKDVSKFSLNIKIKEINDISNLIALCPNHHWEFDNNMLNEKDKELIDNYIKCERKEKSLIIFHKDNVSGAIPDLATLA